MAKFAATNDLPSPGVVLVTMIHFGTVPFSGKRMLFFKSLNRSDSIDWGLRPVTSMGSMVTGLVAISVLWTFSWSRKRGYGSVSNFSSIFSLFPTLCWNFSKALKIFPTISPNIKYLYMF